MFKLFIHAGVSCVILVKGKKKEGCMSSLGTLTHSPERAEKMLFQYCAQRAKDFHSMAGKNSESAGAESGAQSEAFHH